MIPIALGMTLLSFVIHGIAIVPFINFLHKIGFVERKIPPKERNKSPLDRLHPNKPQFPLGGGILIIVLTTILYLFAIIALPIDWKTKSIYSLTEESHLILLTFIGFGLLGFYDDWVKIFGKSTRGRFGIVFGLTPKKKFCLQWALALLIGSLLFFNLKLDFIYFPLIKKTLELKYLFIPFSALIIVSFANAFNITDGLGGLSTGILLIALVAFSIIASASLDLPIMLFMGAWIGGIITFLYFNVYPARIILGDAGALSFGATLGLIGLLTGKIFALVFIGGIYVIEVLSSLIQMIALKFFDRKVFPLAPLHHTFEVLGWPEPKIVMRAWLTGVILAIFGLWLAMG